MFNSLVESIRSFSHIPVLKSNIVSYGTGIGGSSSVSGAQGGLLGTQSTNSNKKMLSVYYDTMNRINDYEVSELTFLIISIYKDYILSYFSNNPIVNFGESVPRGEEISKRINKIFSDIKLVDEIKSHLWEIIYHGSYSFRLDYDEEGRRYRKKYLHNPTTVVTVKTEEKVIGHLVTSRDGERYLTKPSSIFRIGNSDLTLINDLENKRTTTVKEDTLVKEDFMTAGCPLYYYILTKVKEFITKEILISLLSIKDLIQPLLLLLQVDKNTAPDEATKLARNVEKLMNSTADTATLLSSGTGINGLLNMVVHNIRVLPDFQSSMGNMGSVDMSAVTRKIQEMESIQDNKKESLLIANSIPRTLFDGQATKWDAIKSSQRLNSKIYGFITAINDSIRHKASELYTEMTGHVIPDDEIKINLFTKTDVDYNNSINNTGVIGELVTQINNILSQAQQTASEVKIIDPGKYCTYIFNQLKSVDSSIEEFLNEETIERFVKAMQSQEPSGMGM